MAKKQELRDITEVEVGTTRLIYHPLDAGDPHATAWNGHTFEANVPKDIDKSKHGDMIELARGNPWFSVDGKRHKRVVSDREPVPLPGSESEIGDDVDDKKMVEVED